MLLAKTCVTPTATINVSAYPVECVCSCHLLKTQFCCLCSNVLYMGVCMLLVSDRVQVGFQLAQAYS